MEIIGGGGGGGGGRGGAEYYRDAPHFVVVISLALKRRTIFFSVGHQNFDVLWYSLDVVLGAVQLYLLPERSVTI